MLSSTLEMLTRSDENSNGDVPDFTLTSRTPSQLINGDRLNPDLPYIGCRR
jgi:hypothetical protein